MSGRSLTSRRPTAHVPDWPTPDVGLGAQFDDRLPHHVMSSMVTRMGVVMWFQPGKSMRTTVPPAAAMLNVAPSDSRAHASSTVRNAVLRRAIVDLFANTLAVVANLQPVAIVCGFEADFHRRCIGMFARVQDGFWTMRNNSV
jgi:hypothetical protein